MPLPPPAPSFPDRNRSALTMPLPAQVRFPEDLNKCRFEHCLDRSSCGELWQVAACDGGVFLAWLLPPDQPADLWLNLNRVQRLRMPGLAPLHLAVEDSNRPVLVYAFPELTLLDRFRQLRQRGAPGVPRDELLGYLRPLAALLDDLHSQKHYHLALHPRWIFLAEEPDDRLAANVEAALAGLGFVQHVWLATGQPLPQAHGRYAAPELAYSLAGPRCDQYSLALVYAEMRTGIYPIKETVRSRGNAHDPHEAPFDFTFLGAGEGRVLAHALHPEPAHRFASCQELVEALAATVQPRMTMVDALGLNRSERPLGPSNGYRRNSSRSLEKFVGDLVRLSAPGWVWNENRRIRYRLEPGRQLEHHLLVADNHPDPSLALRDFCRHWGAPFQSGQEGAVLLTLVTSTGFWQRLVGRKVGLQVEVQWERFPTESQPQGELRVVLRPYGCSAAEAQRHLEDKGPEVLASLRDHLAAKPEQRTQLRVPYHRPVQVQPVVDAFHVSQAIACVGKDISTGGISFFLPNTIKASQVVIRLEDARLGDSAPALAQIVRRQSCGEGWFEIGARFSS